ncbi:YdeI/OmpD-associated family protein [Nitratireductor luteus]|uniref:YdeI/OmpD-associated family protein n=1 Tax=Nitratireductor luteus TaxID=2976980 RepID=UPI00223EAE82|nr:DUF1801 domain-containing protein [Nitratireductor luteus]
MNEVNPEIEAFFTRAKKWRGELQALRAILLDCPVTEDFKWRSPCYTFQNGNVAALWGLKEYCALAFFKGALLKDAEGLLVAPGENSRSMRKIRFSSVAEIVGMEATLKDYIHEAINVEKAGLKVKFPKDDLELPAELMSKLDEDPDLKTAFEGLTPGRRRGYILYFSQPKQSRTRVSRIEKSTPKILGGKGLHDR